jgi:hypothetical protein
LGIVVALLGVLLTGYQFFLGPLDTPWQLAVCGTVGLVLMGVSLYLGRTGWRITGLVLLGLLAGLEWYFLLVFTRLPPYGGPPVDERFPAFTTVTADGKPFTREQFQGQNTVLVVYRGHW